MVDQQDGNAVTVRQRFENADVPVVAGVGIGLAANSPNALERVDDHQASGRMLLEKLLDLFHQSTVELFRHHGKVQRRRRVLGEIKEPALDALETVFQTEVENFARFCGEVPERFALCGAETQPQGQPGLADLRRSRQQVEALGQQVFHDERERFIGDTLQSIRVDGIQFFD